MTNDEIYWNAGQRKCPNGCYSEETFRYCVNNGWIYKYGGPCDHPHRAHMFNINTGKDCRPCHPSATMRIKKG